MAIVSCTRPKAVVSPIDLRIACFSSVISSVSISCYTRNLTTGRSSDVYSLIYRSSTSCTRPCVVELQRVHGAHVVHVDDGRSFGNDFVVVGGIHAVIVEALECIDVGSPIVCSINGHIGCTGSRFAVHGHGIACRAIRRSYQGYRFGEVETISRKILQPDNDGVLAGRGGLPLGIDRRFRAQLLPKHKLRTIRHVPGGLILGSVEPAKECVAVLLRFDDVVILGYIACLDKLRGVIRCALKDFVKDEPVARRSVNGERDVTRYRKHCSVRIVVNVPIFSGLGVKNGLMGCIHGVAVDVVSAFLHDPTLKIVLVIGRVALVDGIGGRCLIARSFRDLGTNDNAGTVFVRHCELLEDGSIVGNAGVSAQASSGCHCCFANLGNGEEL